ncbi:MAG: SDR family NAD(P)-dependent oxidoreductase [Gordonia paraffinivorans]
MTTSSETQALSGRSALVTGAGTGIGAATAAALAADGARVALLGRRLDKVTAVSDDINGRHPDATAAFAADVTDREALTDVIDSARGRFGPFDLVVANAGAMLAAPFDGADVGEWDRMIATNLTGLLSTARATVDDLTDAASRGNRADLVLVSSLGAHIVLPTYAVYTATKAAVTHLASTLRAELGPRGVRVRSVEPGMTHSDLGLDMTDPAGAAFLEQFKTDNPPIPASAIADAIVWSSAFPPAVNVASLLVTPTSQG